MSAGLGQAPSTQACSLAGIPSSVPSYTVNKVCASGMKAAMLGAASIRLGLSGIVVAGGMESMSRAPYILPTAVRSGGLKYGDQTMVDTLRLDGLTDAATGMAMGVCAEKCATDYNFGRDQSDDYACRSYERAIRATSEGLLSHEIVPVKVPGGRGKPDAIVDQDEEIKRVPPIIVTTSASPLWPGSTIPRGQGR